jgi:UDP-glucuronate 4-epimerase
MDQPKLYLDTDLHGTTNVIEACRKYGVKCVFASSGSVYGEGKTPWVEEQELNPKGPYAISKMFAEEIGLMYHKRYSVDWINLRCVNVIGPFCRDDIVIPIWYDAITKSHSPEVFYPKDPYRGLPRRDFTDVDDIVRGFIMVGLATTKQLGFRTFNLSAGYNTKIEDIAEFMIKELKSKVIVKRAFKLQDHEPIVMHANSDLAYKTFGWKAKSDPYQTIKRYIKWRQKYDNIKIKWRQKHERD